MWTKAGYNLAFVMFDMQTAHAAGMVGSHHANTVDREAQECGGSRSEDGSRGRVAEHLVKVRTARRAELGGSSRKPTGIWNVTDQLAPAD